MGCFGDREKGPPERTARWEFINLEDFKSSGPGPALAYGWLWFMALVSIAVYSVDTFTAVNLLAFNNWSSQVQPEVPFKYSKWIFSICILVSWALLIFEWIRAVRVIRRGGVAESYMDPLAVTLQSMRPQGWKRFLVFKELTNSKKRIDYVALFVYFAFKGAVRVICAEGPRQAVNALTLYSVMQAQLIGHGGSSEGSPIEQFWLNIKTLADQDDRQVIILASMLFTLVIWVFSALSLVAAVTCYLLFLWHYIPQRDARLSIYCRRKIDKRLEKIVEHKVKAAIDEENRKREKAEQKAELRRQKTGELAPPAPPKITRQPTLPQLDNKEIKEENGFGNTLARQNTSSTVSTLPLYSSQTPALPGMQRQPTLPDISEAESRPRPPYRSATQGSAWSQNSFASDAPLLANAAGADGRMQSPGPTYYSRQNSDATFRRPPVPRKAMTNGSRSSRNLTGHMSRMDSQSSFGNPQRSYNPYSATNATPNEPIPRPFPGQRFPVKPSTETEFEEPQARQGFASAADDRSMTATPYTPYRPTADSLTAKLDNASPPSGSSTNVVPTTTEQVTYGNVHGRQASFSRPFGHATPAPSLRSQTGRRQSSDSLHSQQSSFSRQIPPRKPTPVKSGSQGSISSMGKSSLWGDAAKSEVDSYEMTTRPQYNKYTPAPTNSGFGGAGGYMAFSPNMSLDTGAALSTSPPPIAPQGSHNDPTITVVGRPGQDGSYFGRIEQRPPQGNAFGSSLQPPSGLEYNRLTTGYADILDDYGGFMPMEDGHATRYESAGRTSTDISPLSEPETFAHPVDHQRFV